MWFLFWFFWSFSWFSITLVQEAWWSLLSRVFVLHFASSVLLITVIVIGAFVRAYGAGLGCGDDWPLCNGSVFPSSFSFDEILEYTHRLVAAFSFLFVFSSFFMVVKIRFLVARPVFFASLLMFFSFILQVIVGMLVVRFGLRPLFSAIHLSLGVLAFGFSVTATMGFWLISYKK